jgi:hypothetical protein
MAVPSTGSLETPPRAFLSHSSADAELVRAVAAHIGRPFVALDYYEFHTGDEILQAVDEAIEASPVLEKSIRRWRKHWKVSSSRQ